MSEVRDLTAQVEASRKKNYEKFEKAIAISNYERSNFMWFSKSFDQLTKKFSSTSKKCATTETLRDYEECSDGLMSVYKDANGIQASIYNTLESLEWKFLVKEKANLTELKLFLTDLDKFLSELKAGVLEYVAKVNHNYAKSYASNWETDTLAKLKKVNECKELKKQVYENSRESNQRNILAQMEKDPYLVHSSFYLSTEAQKLLPMMKMLCGEDKQAEKISDYSIEMFNKAKELHESKTIRDYTQIQCQKLPNIKHPDLSIKIGEICKNPELYNPHFLRTLHFLTSKKVRD